MQVTSHSLGLPTLVVMFARPLQPQYKLRLVIVLVGLNNEDQPHPLATLDYTWSSLSHRLGPRPTATPHDSYIHYLSYLSYLSKDQDNTGLVSVGETSVHCGGNHEK